MVDRLLASVRAAGEATRMRLLVILSRSELTVTELTQVLGQSQPRISRHLKLMCEAGLLNRFQEGSWAFYRLADSGAGAALARFLIGRIDQNDPTVARDLDRLEGVRKAREEAASHYFADVAGKWDEVRALHIEEHKVEAEMLSLIGASPVGRVLDLGTGTGRLLELVARKADSALGIDLSRDMLAVARTRLDRPELRHMQVRNGDIFALNLDPESFDTALIHMVLHYLDDPARAIDEAARALKPGGKLLIADFAPHTLEFLRTDHAHRRLGFTVEEVANACTAAGLDLIATRKLPPGKDVKEGLIVILWLAGKAGQVP